MAKSSGGGGRSGRSGGGGAGGGASRAITGEPTFGREVITRSQFGATRGQALKRVIPVDRRSAGGLPQTVANIEWNSARGNFQIKGLSGAVVVPGSFSSLAAAKKAARSYASTVNSEAQLG